MARIFLTGSGVTKGYATGSGIITNPVRILLQERDNATGSYPTIARTGDPDFTGQYTSTFDDTNTIIFSGGNLVYPTNLPASSKFVSGGVATPNILQGLTAAGTSSAGTADAHVSFTPGENISPFDESRIYIDNDAEFYATGTARSVLPGFDQRLSSKTSFTIDTNPSVATDFFFSTGTLPNATGLAEGVNTGMGYFNWTDKRWEVIGDLTTGSNIDIINPDESVRKKGLLPCVPANYQNIQTERMSDLTASNGQSIVQTIGFPHSEYGFPFASKYDATGSQLLDMSNYLTAPFLLEKVVLEFNASIGRHVISTNFFGPQVKTFFLMTQKNVSGSTSTFETRILNEQSFPLNNIYKNRTYQHGFSKSIAAFGMVSLIYSGLPEIYNRDLNIEVPGGGIFRTSVTGSYRMEFSPKTPQNNNFGGFSVYAKDSADRETIGAQSREVLKLVGGRSGFDLSDGRSFVAANGGLVPTGSYTFDLGFLDPDTGQAFSVIANTVDSISRNSPFVLLPSDKLVLGFVNIPNVWPTVTFPLYSGGPRREEALAQENVVLSPGAGKITLFGSLLQNNLPKESETNQPLTSDAIHEDLHYDNPVYDQWDVEPFTTLSGSYTDLVITGSMLAQNSSGEYADPEAPNVRKVQASVAAGQAGTTGSLQRFVRLTAQEGKVYDSYPPNAVEVINKKGFGLLAGLGSDVFVTVGAPSSNVIDAFGIVSGSDSDWYMRHAYEVSSQRFLRSSFKNVIGEVFNTSNVSQGVKEVSFPFTAFIYFSGTIAGGNTRVGDGFGNRNNAESFKNVQKYLFGFGDQAYNLPSPILPEINQTSAPLIRGYKYGLGGLFGSLPDARFRRDRYGQFRDMLEQRRFPATLVGGIVEYPVEIKFVPQDSTTGGSEDPARTHSQNLSPFATSSLPYYDGQVKDRSDNPDVTLTPIEVSV
jgi:hypothetical protein